jgi:hypothetical protein
LKLWIALIALCTAFDARAQVTALIPPSTVMCNSAAVYAPAKPCQSVLYATDVNPTNSGTVNDTNMSAHITACVAQGGCHLVVGCYSSPIPLDNTNGPAVLLGATTATPGNADTPYSGLWIDGCGFSMNVVTQRPIAGTVFQGTTTNYPIFAYNWQAGSADYSSTGNFNNSELQVRLSHFAVDTCSTCIQIGNLSKVGIGDWSILDDLYVSNFTGWGLWLENYNNSDVEKITAAATQSTYTGLMWFGSSIPASLYNDGNTRFGKIFGFIGNGSNCLCQNVVYRQRTSAGGSTGSLNDIPIFDIQVSGSSGVIAHQAMTTISGSPIIAVANAALDPVDLPVIVCNTTTVASCAVPGNAVSPAFSTWFVITNSVTATISAGPVLSTNWTGPTASTYTLTTTNGLSTSCTLTNAATSISCSGGTGVATGSATVGNLVELGQGAGSGGGMEGTSALSLNFTGSSNYLFNWGYPPLEIAGYGANGGNVVTGFNAYGMDIEPGGTTGVYLQEAGVFLQFNNVPATQLANSSGVASSIAARYSYGFVISSTGIIPDFDYGSSNGLIMMGPYLSTVTAPNIEGNPFSLMSANESIPFGSIGTGRGEAVGSLPACNAGNKGLTAYVYDASTTPTYYGTATGGGSTFAPVFCTGSTWVYH